MVGASKILTVSYGTFSCTLEGFDDPFNTMRSIAEYFRDLAAEDRYFGAEPPTPDVSHLHALAQHANPRPVEAHVQENGLRLTQSDTEDAEVAEVQPEPVEAPAPVAAQVAAPVVAAAAAATVAAVATAAPSEDDDDLALLLDGIEDDGPLELDDEDDADGNLFDVEAEAQPEPTPKPAYDPRAAIAAKLAAARETVEAAPAEDRRVRAPQVSEEDLAAAAASAPSREQKRPDAFREDLESVNEGKSDLSDEDEAALMAELEALQPDSPAASSKDGKALLESDLIEREEAALERLLAKTNSKLTDDDVQQKRASLSHLKAAVAATMADRGASADHAAPSDPNSAYRDDLAKAVQPTPAAAQAPAPKPKPAPLVLVADRDAKPAETRAKANAPVRPRRVEVAQEPLSRKESDAGFADYAKKVGAGDLSELMEAAAAYLNLVEGAASFTRPQVMHMVLRQENGKEFTREDSLRSFDSLVRKGLIHKVDHGQFAIHEDSRYVS